MRYLTDAERRDFADIIKTYIKKTAGGNYKGLSVKPFMLTAETSRMIEASGRGYSISRGDWGDPHVRERGVVCRNKEAGLPIFLATRVPAYAGVILKERDGDFDLISQSDTIQLMYHYPPPFNTRNCYVKHVLAAIHILENANKVASKMTLEMRSHYDDFLSVLEAPVRYLSVSIKPVARLDDPETLEPPFHGHFDKKHQHLLDDLIHSDAISGRSLVFDAVEITRAKWIEKERFADLFHVFSRKRDLRHATDMVVAWEFDKRGLPPGRIALEIFEKHNLLLPWRKNIPLSEVEAVLEGDRLVGVDVLRTMAEFYQEHFESNYQNTTDIERFIYEGPDRIVDPR